MNRPLNYYQNLFENWHKSNFEKYISQKEIDFKKLVESLSTDFKELIEKAEANGDFEDDKKAYIESVRRTIKSINPSVRRKDS